MNTPRAIGLVALAGLGLWGYALGADDASDLTYTIVDTGQTRCYGEWTELGYPAPGQAFYGQDAQYNGNQPAYRNNGDGTVTDLNTGLMWQADPGDKKTYAQAVSGAIQCRTGGYSDWRLPSIKELYSLILFSGTDPDPMSGSSASERPFINTRFFRFRYGDTSAGDRVIDSQWATNTLYVGRVMNGQQAMFGVNFADGRIKGYPAGQGPRGYAKTFYVIYVRGNPRYGQSDFVDNGDGTVTDLATGLMWMKVDSAALTSGGDGRGGLDWQQALQWAEGLEYAGYSDWRLPNAKELHSIVDYSRSPDTTHSAAIDPVFDATAITNEGGVADYAHYWTSTSHTRVGSAGSAVYIAFGRALGFMSGPGRQSNAMTLMDVHGAGAQRCDVKVGDPSTLPRGRGPQGDVMRIYNLVRCVRGGTAESCSSGPAPETVQQGDQAGPRDQVRNGRPTGADFVRRLDRDGDGQVSRQEFDGPAQHFAHFDRDNDGYISSAEAPTGPPPGRGHASRRSRT